MQQQHPDSSPWECFRVAVLMSCACVIKFTQLHLKKVCIWRKTGPSNLMASRDGGVRERAANRCCACIPSLTTETNTTRALLLTFPRKSSKESNDLLYPLLFHWFTLSVWISYSLTWWCSFVSSNNVGVTFLVFCVFIPLFHKSIGR
jgi:hypothetical protein